jgi:hypothetical protein
MATDAFLLSDTRLIAAPSEGGRRRVSRRSRAARGGCAGEHRRGLRLGLSRRRRQLRRRAAGRGRATVLHRYDLPERGHDAVFGPDGRTLVVFARRPGTFAAVIDMRSESEPLVHPRAGRPALLRPWLFFADGRLLYSTENDFDNARGVIGIYDATDGFRRIGEFFSGGIGPHDMTVLPDGRTMLIANGGLETHPDYGRTVLNVATMKPNLAFIDLADYSVLSVGARADAGPAQAVDPPSRHDGGRHDMVRGAEPGRYPRAAAAGRIDLARRRYPAARPARGRSQADARLYRLGGLNDASRLGVFTSPQGNVAFEVACATGAACAQSRRPADVCGAADRGQGFCCRAAWACSTDRQTTTCPGTITSSAAFRASSRSVPRTS